ncbi:cytochrome P450 [Paraphoma chrysanthemicola]|nr:cytochrome P450 [Paraphoma chrysanthemicola]
MLPLSPVQVTFSLLVSLILYLFTKTLYRLYFHPLSSIPGPKLAAVTSLYNAYHDILGVGLVKDLPALHAKYGPVVRIQPNEVHIGNLEGFNQIYRVGTQFERIWHDNPFLTGSLQSLETLPETKKRRDFISPFFSKSAISRAEPTLHALKLQQFLSTLAQSDGQVINFFLAFRCLTADVVMDYCFRSDLNALEARGFENATLVAMVEGMGMAIVATFFPRFAACLNAFVFSFSESTREKWFAPVYGFETMQRLAAERVDDALTRADRDDGVVKGKEVDGSSAGYTMFDAMARPDREKGQERPSRRDMVADGCLMIVAGTDTTAHALGNILWGVTQDAGVEAKLLAELKRGIARDEIVSSARLEGEGFDYLRAVVKEGLRLSYGVPGRIIRKCPKEGARFGDVWVPGGTVVTSGIYIQNMDPDTFPNPHVFHPERWICDPETYKMRDKQMLSFSRGSRGCIGMNLATATLHLTVAHLFRRFEITTTGYTTEKDMQWKDCFVPSTLGRIKGLVKTREE